MLVGLAAGLISASALSAEPRQLEIRRLADSLTQIPGTFETFDAFGLPVLDEQGSVFFQADGPGASQGIFKASPAGIEILVDRDSALPGHSEVFDLFHPYVTASDDEVCFRGRARTGDPRGLFVAGTGGVRELAGLDTLVPGTSETFYWLPFCALDQGSAALTGGPFGGTPDPRLGVYLHDGSSLSTIADLTVPTPDKPGTFLAATFPPVFEKGPPPRALLPGGTSPDRDTWFLWEDGDLTRLVSQGDAIPNSAEPFRRLWVASFAGEPVLIVAGATPSRTGLYRWSPGGLEVVIDESSPIPGLGSTFNSVRFVAGSPDGFVFVGLDPTDRHGIFADLGFGIQPLIPPGQLLEGKDVLSYSLHPETLRGRSFAFRAVFRDASSGIYLAEVSPSVLEIPMLDVRSLALLSAALLAVGWILLLRYYPS